MTGRTATAQTDSTDPMWVSKLRQLNRWCRLTAQNGRSAKIRQRSELSD